MVSAEVTDDENDGNLGWLKITGTKADSGLQSKSAIKQAVAQLVPLYSPVLFRTAYAILRSRPDAEDVVQETFVRVLRHPQSLTEVREMRVWLVRIAWRLALDRRHRIQPDQMDTDFIAKLVGREPSAENAVVLAEQITHALREIERLPARERQVLLLSVTEEMTTGEIAAVAGRTESATRALLFRARERLRVRLNKSVRKEAR